MVNSVGKKYVEVNRAYLAGMFDADGALMACIEHHPEKKFKFRVRMYVKIAQKNERFLRQLQRELEWGKVRINNRVYELDIKDQTHIYKFIDLVYPYSRLKRRQLDLGRKILETKIHSREDLLQVAQLADTLSSYNVRSRSRRKNYTSKIQAYFSSND
jgi:hypothetical protein